MKVAILNLNEIDIKVGDASKVHRGETGIDPQFFSSNKAFIFNLETKPLLEFCEEIFSPPLFITSSQADTSRFRVKKGG